MRYVSRRTPKGNSSFSYISQEDAESKAKALDARGCVDCIECVDCTDCWSCWSCRGCASCRACSRCSDCSYCSDCTGCSYCSDCSRCRGCNSQPLAVVLALHWPVVIKPTGTIHIGCQEHTVQEWEQFSDDQISPMDSRALKFWNQHKAMILSMAKTLLQQAQ